LDGLTPGPYPTCAAAATTPARRAKPAPITVIRFMTITYQFIGETHVQPVNSPTQRGFLYR
jgi:hypothetical protein